MDLIMWQITLVMAVSFVVIGVVQEFFTDYYSDLWKLLENLGILAVLIGIITGLIGGLFYIENLK